MTEKTVILPLNEYLSLVKSQKLLSRLEQYGVKYWRNYEDALSDRLSGISYKQEIEEFEQSIKGEEK